MSRAYSGEDGETVGDEIGGALLPPKETESGQQIVKQGVESAVRSQTPQKRHQSDDSPETGLRQFAPERKERQHERCEADIKRRPQADDAGKDELRHVLKWKAVAFCVVGEIDAGSAGEIFKTGEKLHRR